MAKRPILVERSGERWHRRYAAELAPKRRPPAKACRLWHERWLETRLLWGKVWLETRRLRGDE